MNNNDKLIIEVDKLDIVKKDVVVLDVILDKDGRETEQDLKGKNTTFSPYMQRLRNQTMKKKWSIS